MEVISKRIELSVEVKKKLKSITKNRMIEILDGSFIELKGTNINCINPTKAIINNKGKKLVLLFYGEYYEDENAFFLYDPSHKCSWQKLKKILG